MIRMALLPAACVLFACLSGCAARGTIFDLNSHATTARRIHLDRGRSIKIKDGGAVKMIPLSRLRSVTLFAEVSRVFESELYYEAKIELKDGTAMATEGNPVEESARTYVCVNDVLIAATQGGNVRIRLDQVSRLFFD